ncbi:MAG: 50S ribosomal protein L30 [Candidatus Aenigmatarchaeota archaeon]
MLAAIRIRGRVGINKEMENTLKMLRLKRVNNCVLVEENPSFKGMLQKVKDFITWGEIKKDVLIKMLKKRLKLKGEKRVDEKILKEVTGFNSFEEFADALFEGKVKLRDYEKINPVFRLTPPSKGFKSVKEYWPKGDLGYRGEEINELIERMI